MKASKTSRRRNYRREDYKFNLGKFFGLVAMPEWGMPVVGFSYLNLPY